MELKQIKKAQTTIINNIKAVATRESIKFLKEKSGIVMKLLSNNHKRVVKAFIEFKFRTNQTIDESKAFRAKVISNENEISNNLPVIEAQYALDKMNPTRLFDCLIPKLRFSEKSKKRCHLP